MINARFFKQSVTQNATNQRGGILIESLIGLLILGLIGGGIMHTTARMAVAQRDMAVQTIAVSQMRTMLMTGKNSTGSDICTSAPSVQVPGSSSPVSIQVRGCEPVAMSISGVSIGGTALSPQPVTSPRTRVFEMGDGAQLLRIGGKINAGI